MRNPFDSLFSLIYSVIVLPTQKESLTLVPVFLYTVKIETKLIYIHRVKLLFEYSYFQINTTKYLTLVHARTHTYTIYV